MTTAWAHAVRRDFRRALRSHVVGTVLAGLDVLAAGGLGLVAWRGRMPGWLSHPRMVTWAMGGIVGAMLIEWIVRLLLR